LTGGAATRRRDAAPQVAPFPEPSPVFDATALNALVAPAGVPAPVLDKLSADTRAVVNATEFADRVRHLGISPAGNTPQELEAWMRREMLRWRRSPRRRTSRPTSDEEAMTGALTAIDCDVHPTVPDMTALLPYLDAFWRATVVERGINSLETVTYPPNAPLTARPQWHGKNGRAATTAAELTAQVCDRWQAGIAILNCLYGVG